MNLIQTYQNKCLTRTKPIDLQKTKDLFRQQYDNSFFRPYL